MAKKAAKALESTKAAAGSDKEYKLMKKIAAEERWLKWGMLGLLILLLLLFLFLGYATDWTNGLRKHSANTPLTTNLDSATTGDGSAGEQSTANGSTGSTTTTTNNTTTPGTPGTNTNSSTNTTNNTERTNTSSSRTETNNNTTTNNTTTTNQPPQGLLNLYADTTVGDTLDSVVKQATELGVDVNCNNEILIRNCTFKLGNSSFSTKSLLGTGLITSVLGIIR